MNLGVGQFSLNNLNLRKQLNVTKQSLKPTDSTVGHILCGNMSPYAILMILVQLLKLVLDQNLDRELVQIDPSTGPGAEPGPGTGPDWTKFSTWTWFKTTGNWSKLVQVLNLDLCVSVSQRYQQSNFLCVTKLESARV